MEDIKKLKERKALCIFMLVCSLLPLIQLPFLILQRNLILPHGASLVISSIINTIIVVFAIIMTVKCRGALSIIGGILMVLVSTADLILNFIRDITFLTVANEADYSKFANFFGIIDIIGVLYAPIVVLACILLVIGAKTSILFKTTIIAKQSIFFIVYIFTAFVLSYVSSILLESGINNFQIRFVETIRYIVYPIIHIATIAVCIIEFNKTNKLAKSCC